VAEHPLVSQDGHCSMSLVWFGLILGWVGLGWVGWLVLVRWGFADLCFLLTMFVVYNNKLAFPFRLWSSAVHCLRLGALQPCR